MQITNPPAGLEITATALLDGLVPVAPEPAAPAQLATLAEAFRNALQAPPQATPQPMPQAADQPLQEHKPSPHMLQRIHFPITHLTTISPLSLLASPSSTPSRNKAACLRPLLLTLRL